MFPVTQLVPINLDFTREGVRKSFHSTGPNIFISAKNAKKDKRDAPMNWNSVLQGLPGRFILGNLAKRDEAKRMSPVCLRQVAVSWAKQEKTKSIGRGKYQKVQQGKSRATAASQKSK